MLVVGPHTLYSRYSVVSFLFVHWSGQFQSVAALATSFGFSDFTQLDLNAAIRLTAGR